MIYFAYGPDLNPAQMMHRSPGHKSLGIARLADHWLSFPRYSRSDRSATISIVENPRGTVWGALYEVPEEDVPILDHIHGFDPNGRSELNEHVGRQVNVHRLGHSKPLSASTYVALPDEGTALPSVDYMGLIHDGARYHGLPKAYLGALLAIRTAPS